MSTKDAQAMPLLGTASVEEDVVMQDESDPSSDQAWRERPSPSSDKEGPAVGESGVDPQAGNAVVDELKGPLDRRLRQRTPGVDYKLIGNPQARVSRTKPISKPDSLPTILPTTAGSPGESGNPPDPSTS
jgi:hypothetical protein